MDRGQLFGTGQGSWDGLFESGQKGLCPSRRTGKQLSHSGNGEKNTTHQTSISFSPIAPFPVLISRCMFTGTYTAIVTPFKNGKVDETALERLIDFQIKGGVDGVVPVGTTGESPTLDYEEHIDVIASAVKYARGRIKIIAGTGANSTAEAVYLTRSAEGAGADASLQVAPYYNKPTQEGLYQHFRAIARATKLPIILYSIPGRCGVEISIETVRRLARDCKIG